MEIGRIPVPKKKRKISPHLLGEKLRRKNEYKRRPNGGVIEMLKRRRNRGEEEERVKNRARTSEEK